MKLEKGLMLLIGLIAAALVAVPMFERMVLEQFATVSLSGDTPAIVTTSVELWPVFGMLVLFVGAAGAFVWG